MKCKLEHAHVLTLPSGPSHDFLQIMFRPEDEEDQGDLQKMQKEGVLVSVKATNGRFISAAINLREE